MHPYDTSQLPYSHYYPTDILLLVYISFLSALHHLCNSTNDYFLSPIQLYHLRRFYLNHIQVSPLHQLILSFAYLHLHKQLVHNTAMLPLLLLLSAGSFFSLYIPLIALPSSSNSEVYYNRNPFSLQVQFLM